MKILYYLILSLIYCSVGYAFDPIYHIGNLRSYENIERIENTQLKDKKILFLGSSVTVGMTSENFSFVDMLSKKYGVIAIKEAVSGTTLVDKDSNSYVSRLKKFTSNTKFDAVVVQLSTNDAGQNSPLLVTETPDNPTRSVEGAILFIIDYVKKNWNCPIVFYTSPHIENEKYDAMVNLLEDIAKKKEIKIVNMYRDNSFNRLKPEEKGLYMYDAIHPTKAGYLNWLPKFENVLIPIFQK